MIIGLIILYIFFGILVFMLCKLVEDNAFYKKPRFYRISVRLCRIIFWPFIIIAIVLYALYIGVIYFYKNLIE